MPFRAPSEGVLLQGSSAQAGRTRLLSLFFLLLCWFSQDRPEFSACILAARCRIHLGFTRDLT